MRTIQRPLDVEEELRVFHRSGDRAARDRAIHMMMPLAESLARRFEGRGEDATDLRQVALLGLLKAASRYDPDRRTGFAAFAVSTILGELKRHFRDHTWALRVPRSVKENSLAVRAALEHLERTSQAITIVALAEETGLTRDQVLEGIEGYQARSAISLDAPVGIVDGQGVSLAELVTVDDDRFEVATQLADLAPAMAQLTDRERLLLDLRFGHGLSQSEIARQIGVSQMQVSRLLRSICERLRRQVLAERT